MNSKVYTFILLVLISEIVQESLSLKCYRCIALSCPDSKMFCDRVRNFVQQQLPDIYYFYDRQTPFCPDPLTDDADNLWEGLKKTSSNSCEEENSGEATCVLGRFRVTTYVTDLKINVSSHGTSLGCAKRKLLNFIKSSTLKQECSVVSATSKVRDSLRHTLEIEHCSVLSEMCSDQDYCISPADSIIKPFLDNPGEGGSYSTGLIIGGILLACVIVITILFSMFGMKYDV